MGDRPPIQFSTVYRERLLPNGTIEYLSIGGAQQAAIFATTFLIDPVNYQAGDKFSVEVQMTWQNNP